jgi:hypothetical protein
MGLIDASVLYAPYAQKLSSAVCPASVVGNPLSVPKLMIDNSMPILLSTMGFVPLSSQPVLSRISVRAFFKSTPN